MKKTINILCFTGFIMVLGATFISAAYADDNKYTYKEVYENSQVNNQNTQLSEKKDTSVSKLLKQELGDLAFNLSNNHFLNKEIQENELLTKKSYWGSNWESLNPWNFSDKPAVKLNNDMNISSGETITTHSAIFENGGDAEQTFSTNRFTYTQTDSVSTTSSHTVGTELAVEAKIEIPFIGGGTTKLAAKYDFNSSKTVETTSSKLWEVPSQNIKVPAKHKYRVQWFLNTSTATGTADLLSIVDAYIPIKISSDGTSKCGYAVGDAINKQKQLISILPPNKYIWGASENWERISADTASRKWGISKYTASFGTELIMSIMDITNSESSPVVLQQKTMDLTPHILK